MASGFQREKRIGSSSMSAAASVTFYVIGAIKFGVGKGRLEKIMQLREANRDTSAISDLRISPMINPKLSVYGVGTGFHF